MSEREVDEALVGIDVGGTFTDFVAVADGQLRIHKVPTTPQDQSRAIVAGLGEMDVHAAEVVHGMTVATNALLERRGATTALLTTAGFADILVIGRQNRPHIYRLFQQRPEPLVADDWRREVTERMDATGRVLQPLDDGAVAALAAQLASSSVESLAIVFLFSYRNAEHEQRAARLVRGICPDLPISLSSEILPEYREYERASTTVINAYVQPLVARYLQRLEDALDESRVRIMQSNGGAMGVRQAVEQAAKVVLSGPAGGVVGAFDVARQAQAAAELPGRDGHEADTLPHVITFDMGGTSTDVALCPGAIPTTAESTITDLPLRLPVIDIHTVGAGGGSVAYVDSAGGLHVGPRSAGAVPGPVCYGRGGHEPTVTDANLILGRLDAGSFLGGSGVLTVDEDAARLSLARLGSVLQLTPEEVALGVIQVANATMERALRRVSVERGYDPRRFALIPFGGAGPLHACDLADALAIRQILVPPMPGVLSAYGMLVADVVYDASHSLLANAEDLGFNLQPLRALLAELQQRVRATLGREGVTDPVVASALDMRYKGQSYELTVPLELPVTAHSFQASIADFHTAHERRYGYAMLQEPVEVVTLRVQGKGPGARPRFPSHPLVSADATPARLADKAVWFTSDGPQATACYNRLRLEPGNRFAGPAIVFQFDTTVVVAPGWHARLDGQRNLWLER